MWFIWEWSHQALLLWEKCHLQRLRKDALLCLFPKLEECLDVILQQNSAHLLNSLELVNMLNAAFNPMDVQECEDFIAWPRFRLNTMWLPPVKFHERKSVPWATSKHRWAWEPNDTSRYYNNWRYVVQNLYKPKISIELRCWRKGVSL